jgi:hypothetical protein
MATLAPLILALALNGLVADVSTAADDEKARAAEVAKHLQNPVANLISGPIENDWDFGSGRADAMTYTASLKPVVPFSLDSDWSLITRTIVPFIYSESPVPGGRSSTGLGDITATVYLSPNEAMRGWDWGVGPGLILPSATDHSLGSGKWSAGPTAAVLRQDGPWTLGMLTGHAWSFAGDADRSSFSTTFLQPFVSYTTSGQTTFGVDTTSEYDWVARQWTVPLELSASQVVSIGKRAVQFGLTGRWYAERPSDGPDWGLGFTVTFTFPK